MATMAEPLAHCSPFSRSPSASRARGGWLEDWPGAEWLLIKDHKLAGGLKEGLIYCKKQTLLSVHSFTFMCGGRDAEAEWPWRRSLIHRHTSEYWSGGGGEQHLFSNVSVIISKSTLPFFLALHTNVYTSEEATTSLASLTTATFFRTQKWNKKWRKSFSRLVQCFNGRVKTTTRRQVCFL